MTTAQFSVSPKPVDPPTSGPSAEERWALLQRIASSEHFSRSARLRDFLLYVGKQSLKPNAPEVHEQEIGSKVFGRPADYDRSQDNIVRVNATELRRRISSYFETVGSHEPLLVEIPRGGYTPLFSYRIPSAPAAEAAEPHVQEVVAQPAAESGGQRHQATRFIWPAICLGLLCVVGVLYLQNRDLHRVLEPWSDKPAVAAFWRQFLDSHLQTDIVMPDDSLSLNEDITNSPVNLYDYVNRNFVRQLATLPLSDDRRADAYEILGHNLVTFGAIRAAQQIQAQIPPNSPRTMVWTRLYTADEIKRNNVVLVGGQKSNPWNHLFDDQMNFIVGYDDSHRRGVIRNRNPKPNEQATYNPNEVSGAADAFATYSVVAFLPNPSRTGHVLILAGIDSDATAAAAEFLSSEDSMSRFRSQLHADAYPYFEALLRVSRLSGTSLRAELVAYRTYPNLH
jgi:hypothetical protein